MLSFIKQFTKRLPFSDKMLFAYHYALALLGAMWYGFPSRDLVVMGVTGTKGKSSVVYLFSQILAGSGHKVASVSSIGTTIVEKEMPNSAKMTMPGRFFLQKFFSDAKKAGCQYAVIEVTSQGIVQSRQRFIDFDTLVFTNLQREHIEAHGSFEKYREAKIKPFAKLASLYRKRGKETGEEIKKTIVVNVDDEHFHYFSRWRADNKIGFSLDKNNREKLDFSRVLIPEELSHEKEISFVLDGVRFMSPLAGRFNVYNILAALALCVAHGIALEQTRDALNRIAHIPGRMELIEEGQPFFAIVDYAHTPDSLEALYVAIRGMLEPAKKMICLLGASGGGRDKWKRPKMAAIAQKYCDVLIFSNEDPYDEDPKEILDEMESGLDVEVINDKKRYLRILDREKAIEKAVALARRGDAVTCSGKGSEQWIVEKSGKKPWNEKKMVIQKIKKIHIKKIHH